MPRTAPTPSAQTEVALPGLDKKDWIAGLEKGLSIIETFDDAHPRMTASQAGERCGMTRTAARRYLLTLQYLGYVATDGKLFWLTPRVLRLGQSYLESARLPRIVQPFLQRVTAGTQEIAYVCVMDGDDIVYIARNGTNRTMNTGYVLGARVPAQVTAAGLLLLALSDAAWVEHWQDTQVLKAYTSHTITSKERLRIELARVRAQGYAVIDQEVELGLRSIAVPVLNARGKVEAALNFGLPARGEPLQSVVDHYLPAMLRVQTELRRVLR